MIKYDCKICIHSQVCCFRDKATQEVRNFDKAVNIPVLEYDLRCKQYSSVEMKGLKIINEY